MSILLLVLSVREGFVGSLCCLNVMQGGGQVSIVLLGVECKESSLCRMLCKPWIGERHFFYFFLGGGWGISDDGECPTYILVMYKHTFRGACGLCGVGLDVRMFIDLREAINICILDFYRLMFELSTAWHL